VIPDVDIAAKAGKDLFLDEEIPKHESGQGYMRVVEHSVPWKEKKASKVFTLPRANDMHGSRQELDDNEQQIQPRKKQERGEQTWYGNTHPRGSRAPGSARIGGVLVTNVESAASSTISTLGNTATSSRHPRQRHGDFSRVLPATCMRYCQHRMR
jgi:hypothetical protein